MATGAAALPRRSRADPGGRGRGTRSWSTRRCVSAPERGGSPSSTSAGLPLAVDKVGHLCRAFDSTDDRVREEILAGTQRALRDLAESCGVEAYLNYGALLGAVRDGAMIAHDSDTDVCYLSRQTSPAEVILESYRVERTMRARGWKLLRMSGGDIKLLLPLGNGRTCHVDVFVAFRVAGPFYQLGNRSGRLPESAIVPLSTIELHGFTFPAPARPEEMLEFVYGPGWRVPDPAFRYADPVDGIRRLDGWLRGFRTDMGAWTEFHRAPGAVVATDGARRSPAGSAPSCRPAYRWPTSARGRAATRPGSPAPGTRWRPTTSAGRRAPARPPGPAPRSAGRGAAADPQRAAQRARRRRRARP